MRKAVLFLIFYLIILNGFSQEEITINYQEMRLTSKKSKVLEPINYGDFYTFHIDDINMFLYQVTIKGESIKLDTSVPTELQTLFRLSKQELKDKVSEEPAENEVNEIETNTKELKNTLESIKSNLDFNISNKEKDLNVIKDNLSNTKSNQKDYYLILKEQEIILEIIKNENELKEQIGDLISDMDSFLNDLNKLLIDVSYINVQKIQLIILATRDVSYKQMLADIVNDDSLKPKDPLSNFKKLGQRIDALKIKLNDLKPDLDQPNVIKLEKEYKKIYDAYLGLKQDDILTSYSQVLYLYNELQNKSNFTAKAPPVQANGDFVNYEVTITPAKTHELGAYKNEMTFEFDVPVKGGLKVDFSVGPIFAFGDGALDEKFYFEKTDIENTGVLKKRDNNNLLNPGIAAMMHYYKRSGKNYSWGGLFGVGAGFQTIEDINLSFYGGLSYVMGKEQKIMLNTGVAFINVDRLKNGEFNIDTTYDTNTVSINDLTEKVFKSSFFISLSYSLASRNNK